jgi:hypothetical protein
MQLTHLIYASRPFGYDDLTLTGILAAATRNNARLNITGALICREDLFLQWLEGPDDAVTDLFARIARDPAHTDVKILSEGKVAQRLFPDWAMRHDPAQSWMWTPREVDAGAVKEAKPIEAQAVFVRLASGKPSEPQKCPFHR